MALKQAFSTTDGVTDVLYVATNISCKCDVPPSFVYEYPAPKPIKVLSPVDRFSDRLQYDFADLFLTAYDPATKTWRDESSTNPGNLPLDVKADVLVQQISYDIYVKQQTQYDLDADTSRWAAYRTYVAQILITEAAGPIPPPPIGPVFVEVNGNYDTVVGNEIVQQVGVGASIITLYTAVGNAGRRITIKNSGDGVVSIIPFVVGQTIDGETIPLEVVMDESYDFVSSGTNWLIT
jgi:hypothetical protein